MNCNICSIEKKNIHWTLSIDFKIWSGENCGNSSACMLRKNDNAEVKNKGIEVIQIIGYNATKEDWCL